MAQPKSDGAATPMTVTSDGRWLNGGYGGSVRASLSTRAGGPQITGAGPEAWFGPQQPLAPMAPDGVGGRAYDYSFGSNLNYVPRSGSGVAFADLRALADALPLLASVIEARKNRIASWAWAIQSKGGGRTNLRLVDKVTQAEIDRVTVAVGVPDRRRDFHTWLRPLVDDMLVIDAACLYPRKTRGGKLFSLDVVDGATIKPLIGEDGRAPLSPDPAYQQVLHGVPAADFALDELMYLPRNVRSRGVYGYSAVEQVLLTVNIALRREVYNLEYYRSGTIPDSFGTLPKEWSVDQIKQFQDYFDGLMAGNLLKRRGIKFMPGDFKAQDVRPPPLKDQYDEWLARIICFAFQIPPSAFVPDNARATAQTLQLDAENDGSVPQKAWVKGFMDRIIQVHLQAPGLEFAWVGDDSIDPLEQAQALTALVTGGIKTVDEARDELGLAPLSDAQKADMAEAAAAKNPAVQAQAQAGENQDGTANQPAGKPAAAAAADGKTPPKPKKPTPGQNKDLDSGTGKAAEVAELGDTPFVAKRAPKGFKRLDPISYDRKAVTIGVKSMKALWQSQLMAQGHAAAAKASAILSSRLGKAGKKPPADDQTPTPDDAPAAPGDDEELTEAEIAEAADEVISSLDLDLDGAEMADLETYLQSVAADAGSEALAQVGLGDTDDVIFEHLNQAALDWAKEHAAELVSQISDTTRDAVRDAIVDGITENMSTSEIADVIANLGAFDDTRADLIANTEIRFANSYGALEGYKASSDNGVDVLKSWLIAEDNVCDDCTDNADEGPIELDADFPSGDDAPPAHPNAVLSGSTFVPYGGLERMIAAKYDGFAVSLHAGDYRTTIGPNHPMLTDRGMVKAKFLKVGDHLVYDRRAVNAFAALSKSDLDQSILVQNAFRSLKVAFGHSTITAARDDFHGDEVVRQEEVQVVFPNRKLLAELDSCGVEEYREGGLMRADVQPLGISGGGAPAHDGVGVLLPAAGGVGGGNVSQFVLLTISTVETVRFEGWAFDCTTPSSLYCSDGFVVSNCRCAIAPYVRQASDAGDDDQGAEDDATESET